MMLRCLRVALSLYAVMTVILVDGSAAQEVASRDLSDQVVPTQPPTQRLIEYNKGHCPGGGTGIVADTESNPPPAPLKLIIVSLEPRAVEPDGSLKITLQLQNISQNTVRIPWETEEGEYDPLVEANEEHPFAYFGLYISDREHSIRFQDMGSGDIKGALFAANSYNASFLDIGPGQWATVVTTGNLSCSSSDTVCQKLEQGGQFWVLVTWDEDVAQVGHRRCYVGIDQYSVAHAVSDPVAITVIADDDDD